MNKVEICIDNERQFKTAKRPQSPGETCRVIQQLFWMKECDILRVGVNTPPTYFQGVRTPQPQDLRLCSSSSSIMSEEPEEEWRVWISEGERLVDDVPVILVFSEHVAYSRVLKYTCKHRTSSSSSPSLSSSSLAAAWQRQRDTERIRAFSDSRA